MILKDLSSPEIMVAITTTIPAKVIRRVRQQADLEHLKLADYWRRWILEKFKEEIGE